MKTRRRPTFDRVLTVLLPVVAALMLAVMLIPAEAWRRPSEAAAYRGFDPNLLSVQESGPSVVRGKVEVSRERLLLAAILRSTPTVHLVTSPLSFRTAMDIRVLQSNGSGVVSVGIWSPRTHSGYFLNLTPADGGTVTAEAVERGQLVRSQRLGAYSPGLLYRLNAAVDRTLGTIAIGLSAVDTPPGGGGTLRLTGGPADRGYADVVSKPVRAAAGREYLFGGLVKLVEGSDAYKIAVQWFDGSMRVLAHTNDWRPVGELRGWSRQAFRAQAPTGTAYARLILGSGNDTQLLFARPFMAAAPNPGLNLLLNGDLQEGALGWEMASATARGPEVLPAHAQTLQASATAADLPQLLASRRLSLSVSVSSQEGITRAVLQDYALSLPDHRWQAVRVDDVRARLLVIALTLVGAFLGLGYVWVHRAAAVASRWGRPRLRVAIQAVLARQVWLPAIPIGVVGAGLLYALLNGLLFGLGNLPFDMTAAKLWTYAATQYGPSALYFLPNTVGLAKVWGGVPYHEAVFPYHPVMAYYFSAAGWLYRTFLNGPGPLVADTFQLEWLLKGLNVLVGALDALFIYLILRKLAAGRRRATSASLLFLLNPALILGMSIWGQNHVVSLLPLLIAIWAAEHDRPTWAWIALAAAVLTRPQMVIPGALVALMLLRRFPPLKNLYAVCWAVVVSFIALAPFALAISPSLPVDIAVNQLYVQEGGGNEEALTTVSLGAYSIWPLLTGLVAGERGLNRFSVPSSSPFIGGVTFQHLSQILVVAAFLVTAGLMLARRSTVAPGGYLPLLALGSVAFLVLKTGLAATHFLIALPMLILMMPALSASAYYAIVGSWTLVTYVSLFGSLAYAIQPVPALAPALDPGGNRVAQLHASLYSADWAISAFTVLSVLTMILVAVASLRSPQVTGAVALADSPGLVTSDPAPVRQEIRGGETVSQGQGRRYQP